MERVVTACRICGARCGIVVTVDGDRVASVRGDKEHPISQGFTCVKGRALGELHHHPDRLNYPLARRKGQLRRVSWDQALTEIAEKLKRIVDESGPDAIATYSGSGSNSTFGYVGPRGFLATLGSGSFFSASSIDLPSKYVVEFEMTGLPRYVVPLADVANTGCLMLLGTNPAVSMGHDYSPPMGLGALRQIKKRGGALIVVDPRATESSRLADVHVVVRPGADAFLLQALLRVLLEDGLADREFIERHCSRLDELTACVRSRSLEFLASRCDVPRETIIDVARRFAKAETAVAIAGTGLTFGRHANVAIWLQWCLNAVTGNLDRQGGMYFNRGVLNPIAPKPSERGLYHGRQSRVRDVRSLNGEMPSSALADEILIEGPGRIRALLVHGGNPLIVLPNQQRTEEALKKLDLLVSMDIFLNQTASFADYVLPGVDQLEREDLSIIGEQIYPVPFAQVYRQAVEPAYERRSEYEVYRSLLPLMGRGEEALAPGDEVVQHLCRRAEIPLDELRQHPHGKVTGPAEYGWLLAGLQTPDRRLNLAPALCVDEFRRMCEEDGGSRDDFAAEQEFPLRLVARRLPAVFNSWLSNLPSIARRTPVNPLFVHPDDAARWGLSQGGDAVVESSAGQVTARVEVTPGIHPGVVSLPHGWGPSGCGTDVDDDWRGANVNLLTADGWNIDPITGMPLYTGIPVRVSPSIPRRTG